MADGYVGISRGEALGRHSCNAWCNGDTHVKLLYTNEDPPRALALGIWHWYEQLIQIVQVEPAGPEIPPDPNRPEGYDFAWLVWYRYLE